MRRRITSHPLLIVLSLSLGLSLAGCGTGVPGPQGPVGPTGPQGPAGGDATVVVDLGTASNDDVAALKVTSTITSVTIANAPVVAFSVTTSDGTPITGIGALWDQSNRYVRFTLSKLVPGTDGSPSRWVAYTRDTNNDGTTPPDYDTGSGLIDNGDGTYLFTFNTDVDDVTGVSYEPSLSHRVAGQIGSGDVSLEPQNLVYDFVPAGGAVTQTRNIATMQSCNECHDDLVFHGRRFLVSYCVACHTSELADGEGDMAYMTHKIHAAHKFDTLDDGIDYAEVTYPQDLTNCRKCHSGEDQATTEGDNWKTVPSMSACGSCHQVSYVDPAPEGLELHSGGAQADNAACTTCHPADGIEESHLTANATPNNPNLPDGVPSVVYSISDVTVDDNGVPTVTFAITADGEVLDMGSLSGGFVDGDGVALRWPGFLMAWSEAQGDIAMPADFTNTGQSAAQPVSVSLGDLVDGGGVTCTSTECVADFAASGDAFPTGAMMRTIGLQGYLQFDADGDGASDYSLHTPSAVLGATGDEPRRTIVDSNKCANCHEWFEGHGGNRVYDVAICTMCHVPHLSTSGRAVDPALAADRDGDAETTDPSAAAEDLGSETSTWPEDTNNLKEMIHGIHASAARTSAYTFVRGRNDGILYDWSEVTFPAEDGTRNCLLCHLEGTYEFPLADNVLETTVRTSGTDDGLDDSDHSTVEAARDALPNVTDWVNTPMASTCYYCHDSEAALAHVRQNGGVISIADPGVGSFTQRQDTTAVESCVVCHGDGKTADIGAAHGIE